MSSITGGNPSGPNKAARANPLGQPPGGQVLFASVSRSEKRDQRTLPKQAPGKQHIPSPGPRGWRFYLEPSGRRPTPAPNPPLLADYQAVPPALRVPILWVTPAEAQRGMSPRRRCVCWWCSLAGSKGHSGRIGAFLEPGVG